MRFFARRAGLRHTVALVLAAISTAGCMYWQPAATDASYVTARNPGRVRATLANGDRVVVWGATVVDSQLVGDSGAVRHWARVAIPVRQVKSIEVLQLDPGRTLLFVGVAGLVVWALNQKCLLCVHLGGWGN